MAKRKRLVDEDAPPRATKKIKAKNMYRVAEHCLVPEHILLTEKEKKALFEKYHLLFSELPKIMIADPALEGLDIKVGDVVKIVKTHSVVGKTEYYRGVTNE